MTALHASSRTLQFPGEGCAFHVSFLSTSGSVDGFMWHSSFNSAQARAEMETELQSCCDFSFCSSVLLGLVLSQLQIRLAWRGRGSLGDEMCVCLGCILRSAWDSKGSLGWWKQLGNIQTTKHAWLEIKSISGYILLTATIPSSGTRCWWGSTLLENVKLNGAC